jgi:hypothetical protein
MAGHLDELETPNEIGSVSQPSHVKFLCQLLSIVATRTWVRVRVRVRVRGGRGTRMAGRNTDENSEDSLNEETMRLPCTSQLQVPHLSFPASYYIS